MRYRALDTNGDYAFGKGPGQFLVDSPEAVAQAVRTRLALWSGEWYLDTSEGTDYEARILGNTSQEIANQAIQERILATPGVLTITDYINIYDSTTRTNSVTVGISTIYGATSLTQAVT